jgi:signal transduction histidine kinase
LREVVEAAAESIEPVPAGMKIEISLDYGTEVVVDRTRAERVFTNLLSNAAEAMPEGGEVYIHARDDDDRLLVFVEDTGPGLPETVRAQLFRPFVTGKRSGLGLGLTLSRQAMLELGGDLQLVSEPGSGARFCLTFPKAPKIGSQDSELEQPRPSTTSSAA